jgi:ABC-type nitrate/sulfonate/bicarbonate transport system permease component
MVRAPTLPVRRLARLTSGSGVPLATIALVILPLLVWEVVARAGLVTTLFFPAPSTSAVALMDLATSGILLNDLAATLGRLVRGFLGGAAAGVAVGTVLGSSSRAYRVINPLVALAHPVPKIALLPLALLVFGVGETAKIVIIAVSTFFPLVINTTVGVREVGSEYLDVARSYGARRSLVLRRVVLPGSLPAVVSGARLGFNTALVVTIAIELISAGDGLGARVWSSWQQFRADRLFATLAVIAVLGLVGSWLLEALERRAAPWRDQR